MDMHAHADTSEKVKGNVAPILLDDGSRNDSMQDHRCKVRTKDLIQLLKG